MLAETLCEHVVNKKRNHFQNLGYRPGTEVRIAVLQMDDDKDFDSDYRRYGQCSNLYPAANYLNSLKEKLESLKDESSCFWILAPCKVIEGNLGTLCIRLNVLDWSFLPKPK